MKKGIFLFLLSITFFAVRPYAQGIHIGLKAGSVGSQFTGRAFNGNMQWGFSGGAFAELGLTGKWGFQGEMLYNQIKSETADDFEDLYQQGGIPSRTFTLNYLNIPILLNYRFLPILSLQLGPQFGVLLSSSDNITANGVDPFRKNSFSMPSELTPFTISSTRSKSRLSLTSRQAAPIQKRVDPASLAFRA